MTGELKGSDEGAWLGDGGEADFPEPLVEYRERLCSALKRGYNCERERREGVRTFSVLSKVPVGILKKRRTERILLKAYDDNMDHIDDMRI